HWDAEAGELVVAIALADAEIEPAAGQQVEGGGLFGQENRVVPGQDRHRGAEAERGGAGADPGQQVQRGRNLSEAGEVVLDEKGALVAECLGLNVVLDELAIADCAVNVRPAPLGLRAPE